MNLQHFRFLEEASLRGEQLWYVAHPVHPTEEEVTDGMQRLRGYVGGSPGRREELEIKREVIRGNVANAKTWMPWLDRWYPTITWIAPWISALDGSWDDDLDPAVRARGLRDCRRTVKRCDGLVLVGGRVSGGMLEEADRAGVVIDLTFIGRDPPASFPKEAP